MERIFWRPVGLLLLKTGWSSGFGDTTLTRLGSRKAGDAQLAARNLCFLTLFPVRSVSHSPAGHSRAPGPPHCRQDGNLHLREAESVQPRAEH